ncbi:hypothetical protein KX928_08415 [Roseobacter sp. YSTF-M11]|uniref:Lipoprotein n=1 Tax=Roseobacter insulae TaxID=2859783 RepID=A0A9X1FUY9_9RHOB|nr:hypothetical protein [Roseobacter insulae]MBW4707807.1 hypothetical protein [Roseobacter insulae]
MFMYLRYCVFFVALAACGPTAERVTANFQYSNAGSLGTQNAGLFEPGSLFLWNTQTNELSFLDVLDLTPVGGSPAPANITSSNVSAIEISGVPVGSNNDLVRARVGAQAAFTAKSALREDYKNLVTALANYVGEMVAEGTDPDLALRPRDPGFRLVLVRSVIRAEDSELRIGGTDATDPNSVVAVDVGSGVSFNVRAGSSTSCSNPQGSASGTLPACFFNVAIFDPQYVEGNPRMQFNRVVEPADNLADALRSLR